MIVITFNEILRFAAICIAIGAAIGLCRGAFGWWMDDTDRDSWHRSGLKVLTDNATGVQYVSDGNSLVVRVGADGKPVITAPQAAEK